MRKSRRELDLTCVEWESHDLGKVLDILHFLQNVPHALSVT